MLTYDTHVQSYIDCSVKIYERVCIFVRRGHLWPVLDVKLKGNIKTKFSSQFFLKEDAGRFVI
jgi:hypothetical protein